MIRVTQLADDISFLPPSAAPKKNIFFDADPSIRRVPPDSAPSAETDLSSA